MKRKTRVLTAAFLTAAFAVTAGFAVQGHVRAARYQAVLSAGYQHAFAELTTAVSELDTALQKGVYAATPGLFSSLCTQAYGKALSAQAAIGELPYGNLELEQTAAFLAKTGDYAMYLSRSAAGDGCTQEERDTLRGLSGAASQLSSALRDLQSDLNAGSLTLESVEQAQARLAGTQAGQVTAGSAFQTVEADFPEVPSLVYDGPFSEHLTGRSPQYLAGKGTVTQDEARARAAAFLDLRPEIFELTSQGEGELPAWGFTAAVDGGELYVEVTRQGGQVLEVLSSRPVDEAVLTRAEALDMASAFLKARGFPAMKESYFIDQGDVLTIHFAALEGEVLCYPDLVKVAVALDNGDVVGFESAGFLMNHRTRQLSEAAISESAASQVVGSSLEILSHQLTLIPSGGEYEVLCHEFKCRTQEDTHVLIYVNAQTGQEEQILLLLEDESGTLAL